MAGRPELARALDDLDTGDELVIAEWDRATRSMWDGLQIIKAVIDAGAAIKVLDRSYIDLTTPMGRGFMAMIASRANSAPTGRSRAIADVRPRLRPVASLYEASNGVVLFPSRCKRIEGVRGAP